jgi:hypothetical protein
MIKDKDINFLKRSDEHPHLRNRFEEILNVAESDDLNFKKLEIYLLNGYNPIR